MSESIPETSPEAGGPSTADFANRDEIRSGLLTWDRAIAVVSDGIFVVDAVAPEFPISDCNPAFEEITGYSRDETRGQSCFFLIGPDTDGDKAEELRNAVRTGSSCKIELEQYRKDGSSFWSETIVAPARDTHGRPTHIVGVLHDISEQREAKQALRRSEDRFRTAFHLGPAAASITTLDKGRFIAVNESFSRMLGYRPEDVVGRTADEIGMLTHPPGGVDLSKALRQEGSFRHVRHRIRDASGKTRVILISAALVHFEGAEHVLSLFSDRSQQVELERELLRISDEERRRFAHDLHDSLGSRFTGISMLGQGLAAAARRGETVSAEDLEEIARLAGEGTEKTRAVSRGLNPVGLDERSLEAALQQLTSDTWTVSRIDCRFKADPDLPELHDEVKNHLYRIAQEAVTNAVKHADAERIHIHLANQKDRLVLSVLDDGRGLPESDISREGMGLRIMRYRADLIGADIEFETSGGGGTCVRCKYPLGNENATE